MNLDNLKVQRGKNGWTPEQVTQAEKIAIKKADTYNTVTTAWFVQTLRESTLQEQRRATAQTYWGYMVK
jgi:hypothetical protein